MKTSILAFIAAAVVTAALPARAEAPASEGRGPDATRAVTPRDVRDEVPIVAYTHSAFGASALTGGVAGFAGAAGRVSAVDATQLGGGARLWASPVDRLTLFVEVDRRTDGGEKGTGAEAAPSATISARLLGSREKGYGVGALASYRAEGFGELEGEIELGALFSLQRSRLHADTNFVFGTGVEEKEADGEWKLRLGYDATSWLRVGVDGRARYRLAGDRALAGGRVADAIGGPEVLVGGKGLFLGASGGPSTVGVAEGVGWYTRLTFGGVLL